MLQIADISLDNPLLLAPLAGYTDLSFRQICREHGAALCVSEMISCHGLFYRQAKTISMLASSPEERPVSFQLFGADPDIMEAATEIICEYKPDMIDINMGCPVKKVTKKGAGAALMAQPKRAEEILRRVVARSTVPVTAKFRLGVDLNTITCHSFAQMAADCGVAAVTIHGRSWSQGFSGTANWEYIRECSQILDIPVIGNGDITCYGEAMEKIENGYCDGVMIGRGALGNPWAFSQQGRPTSAFPLVKAALRHLELMGKNLDPERQLGFIKNHIGKYFREFKKSAQIRRDIYAALTYDDLKLYLQQLLEILKDTPVVAADNYTADIR